MKNIRMPWGTVSLVTTSKPPPLQETVMMSVLGYCCICRIDLSAAQPSTKIPTALLALCNRGSPHLGPGPIAVPAVGSSRDMPRVTGF
ncbi:hypothetical protein BO78DRAFT_397600 [Aspergillus sclerotiicarbonarius CBS 121057]|uniref:Uncharacterized protein n=1 Tax=Aspergillus sclerotiicarbonarius (strain CBS 121057 / IBT 28362) TaxID=1448318 RepID=A0A319E769_ASPSB|nr:hypothetical protein BO78DRAFT_397600 [Aspergillus sclerotiicarbonarius CBS 121057]